MYWVDTPRSASTPTDSLQRTRLITRKPRATLQRGNPKAGELLLPGFLGVAKLATQRPHKYFKHRPSAWPSQYVSEGAGGGTRTHKSFRSGTCGVPAFTSFATPAPPGCEP